LFFSKKFVEKLNFYQNLSSDYYRRRFDNIYDAYIILFLNEEIFLCTASCKFDSFKDIEAGTLKILENFD